MSRTNTQATIVSGEQLVPRVNRLVTQKNNRVFVTSDVDINLILYTDNDAILYSTCLNTSEESANETDDADDSDMDLSDDNPQGNDDAAGFGVFIYIKFTETPNSTYFSPTVTSSSLDFIQNLLNETPVNELTDFMSNPVYTDA
ncbi:hypothetical protein Tco_1524700 [Tanacetum coccineum]